MFQRKFTSYFTKIYNGMILSFIQTDNVLKVLIILGVSVFLNIFMQYLECYDLSLMIKMCQKKNVGIIY